MIPLVTFGNDQKVKVKINLESQNKLTLPSPRLIIIGSAKVHDIKEAFDQDRKGMYAKERPQMCHISST